MKRVLFLISVSAFAFINVFSQTTPPTNLQNAKSAAADLITYGVRVEPDKRLIVVMAALESAGVETTSLSQNGEAFRQKLKTDLSVDAALRRKMTDFVRQYKQRHSSAAPAEIIAPFVSLAYALGPVPELTEPARTADLPADLLEVLDFAPFVREFYKNSKIEAKLPEYVRLYQVEGDKMSGAAAVMIKSLLDYLHTKPALTLVERTKSEAQDPKNKNKKIEVLKPVERERRFFIVPDLLASTGTVNFRNVRDDYYVVVPPNTNLRISEARRAYLQYVLDPLILKNGKDIAPFRENIKQLLDTRRKENENISPDIFLAVLRSLVAAVDAKEIEFRRVDYATNLARQKINKTADVEAKKAISAQLSKDKQVYADETAITLSEAYERGAVLAFYFAEQLKGLENSGFDISSSFRDMILSLNTAKESNRLAEVAEARRRGIAAREERRKSSAQQIAADNQAIDRTIALKAKLDQIETVTKAKNYAESETQLKNLLNEYPNEAGIYYALGRVASLSAEGTFDEGLRDKRLEDARLNYGNAIRQANPVTNQALIQLSYVALGRIFEFYDDNESALKAYQAAEKLGNVTGGAQNEAKAAILKLTAPKKP